MSRASRARPADPGALQSRARTRRPSAQAERVLTPGAAGAYRLLAWAVVALYGVAVLAMVMGPHRIGDVFAESDFYGGYVQGARGLLHGHLDPSRYGVVGPGYEVALALLGAVVPNLFVAAELLSAVAMLAALILWIRIVARRVDPRLALIAALFMVTNATFFRYGYSVTNDALAFALQAGAVALLLLGTTTRTALLAGALAALAFLTRYNAVALVPAGLVALLAGGTLYSDRRRGALLFTAGFAALVVPWMVYCLASGQSFSFQFHHNIAYDVFARAKGIPWDDYQKLMQPQFKTLGDVIARDPGAVFARELFNVWDHLGRDARSLLGMPVALCGLIGLVFVWADGTLRRLWPVALAAALFFVTLVPIFYSERYSIPLLPAYAILAAAPFASPRLTLGFLGALGPWAKLLVAALPLGLSLAATVSKTRYDLTQLPVEVLECAQTLRAEARPGDKVICRKAHIAFHGGVDAVGFPFAGSLADLAAAARAHDARWLFFSWPEAELRPVFWYLLDTTAAVPGLTIRRATAPRPAVLFEIGPGFGQDPVWLANDTLRTWHAMRARLRVDPFDVEALRTLGAVEFDRREYGAAREHLQRALSRDPRHFGAWMLLGETNLLLEDGASAERAYQQALGVRPGNSDAQIGLGWASLVSRRANEAAARWRPVISFTRDPHTLERMIEVYRALGDAAAESEARAALARVGGGR